MNMGKWRVGLLLAIGCVTGVARSFAQDYLNVDSSRKIMQTAKMTEQRFLALRSLDRYYYSTGLYDSSAAAQKEMFALAHELKEDSLLAYLYRAIGNRYAVRADYNFSIVNYSKGLEYTGANDQKRASLYLTLAYVYVVTGNVPLALDCIQKGKAIGQSGPALYFQNVLYGEVYNILQKPDSALFYFRKAEDVSALVVDPILISLSLLQTGRAYELKGDPDLAETYYKKSVTYCNEKHLPSSIIRTGVMYCDFLISKNRYPEARAIALEDLQVAREAQINEGISTIAGVLRTLHVHAGNKDSIIYYGQLQLDYKDSVSNQKRISEFQNIVFAQQLKDIDEQAKAEDARQQRKQNLQYASIAFGIIVFVMLFLLLSRKTITNEKLIRGLSVLALLVVYEFLNLLLHPFLEEVTHHSPLLLLLALVGIGVLLVPLHHRAEKWATEKLVEKNKQARLEAARKTIRQLS